MMDGLRQAGAPLGKGRGVVVMIHGRNAGPENILSLVPALGQEDLTYLAPAAPGRTWYPLAFLAPTNENEPHLSAALATIAQLLADVAGRGIGPERVALLGFSQGACLAAEFAVRHATRYGAVVVFTGGVIGPPGTTWTQPGAFDGTPVFLGSSDVDAHVPLWRVEETAAVFTRMGADVDTRIYPQMGHLVNEDEIAHARQLLNAIGRTARSA